MFTPKKNNELRKGTSIVSEFTIMSDCLDALRESIGLAFTSYEDAKYYSKTKDSLTLYWYASRDYVSNDNMLDLPFPLTKENAFEFIYNWYMSVEPSDREKSPYLGGDGSHGNGFSMNNKGDGILLRVKSIPVYYSK